MRVLVLTPYPYGTTAGPRSSFELWERVLRDADIYFDYAVFESDRLHEILTKPGHLAEKAGQMLISYARFVPQVFRKLRSYDAVLVNREATLIGPAVIETLISHLQRPLIYLLDDPLYIPYRSPANGWLSYLKFFGKVRTLCQISSAVLANSPSHVHFAERHNANVWEIPSLVDGDVYDGWLPRSGSSDQPVCVGWSGSPTTVTNLEVIRHPLKELSTRADVKLLFIGSHNFGLADVRYTARQWHPETEVDDLRLLDIGLVPIANTPWAPHKFYLKLVQYMALGIPPVASPIGSNPLLIDDSSTGFLARDDSEWRRAIQRLITDLDLREEIGKNAAELAHKQYTLQANAEKIVTAFRSVLT